MKRIFRFSLWWNQPTCTWLCIFCSDVCRNRFCDWAISRQSVRDSCQLPWECAYDMILSVCPPAYWSSRRVKSSLTFRPFLPTVLKLMVSSEGLDATLVFNQELMSAAVVHKFLFFKQLFFVFCFVWFMVTEQHILHEFLPLSCFFVQLALGSCYTIVQVIYRAANTWCHMHGAKIWILMLLGVHLNVWDVDD